MLNFLISHKDIVFKWLHVHRFALNVIGLLSFLTFIGTLILIPILLVKIPSDYFVRPEIVSTSTSKLYRVFRYIFIIIKNIFGIVFMLSGFIMLFLPGQGVLTILIGLSLMNFTGKRNLERKIVQKQSMHSAINWIRAKAGKELLLV